MIAFGGIYIFVGSYIAQNVFSSPHIWGFTQVITILYGVLVVAPVVVGLKFGVRVTVALYVFEVVLLLVLSVTILARGGASGLSATPFRWPGGGSGHDVLLAFSLAVLAFGGFEAAAPLAAETRDPRRNVPIAVLGAVVVSGIIYVVGSYALVTAFGVGHAGALAADANPFHTAAKAFVPFIAPLITWVFLSSVTSSYVAANTQTSRVIFAGARGGLWSHALAGVSPRFRTPAAAAVAFVAPEHPHRRRVHRVHRPGYRIGVPRHLRHPRADHHVPGGECRPGRRVGEIPPPGHHQELLALGGPPVIGVVVLAIPVFGVVVLAIPVWGDLRPGQPRPYDTLPWLTLALVAVGVIYALVLSARRPRYSTGRPRCWKGTRAPPSTRRRSASRQRPGQVQRAARARPSKPGRARAFP